MKKMSPKKLSEITRFNLQSKTAYFEKKSYILNSLSHLNNKVKNREESDEYLHAILKMTISHGSLSSKFRLCSAIDTTSIST